jgi:pyruvate dehydrogenase E2 component (dihydrolipoamide acetyltransferase)
MIKQVEVPPLGEQKETETQLNSWLVKVGQQVRKGDDLAELVTDKAAFNLPSPDNGTVVRLLVKEGATVQPGEKLIELEVGV